VSFEIKKGMPPPKPSRAGGRPCDYPFDAMKPGTYIDVQPRAKETLKACAQRVRTAAASWRHRKGPSKSFIVRDNNAENFGMPYLNSDGTPVVRVWAVKPEDSISPLNRSKQKKV